MIFLIVGVVAAALGIFLIAFRKAAAAHAEGQVSKIISSDQRPSYSPWFIMVIGIGMVLIGAYFIMASVFRLMS